MINMAKNSMVLSACMLGFITLTVVGATKLFSNVPDEKKIPKDVPLETLEDLKESLPNAKSWTKRSYNGLNYAWCQDVIPSYGISEITFHAWVFRTHSKQWEPIFVANTYGLYEAAFEFDKMSGMLQIIGKADNEFENKKVVEFNLNATRP